MVKMRGFVNLKLPQYKYKNIPDWFYSQVCLNCTLSAFFSVIWLAKCCRALSLAIFAHADNDKNDDSHNIREHFENLLHASWKAWDIEIHPVQNTEQIRAPYGIFRTPGGKNNQCYGQPAEAFNTAVICPCSDVYKRQVTGCLLQARELVKREPRLNRR